MNAVTEITTTYANEAETLAHMEAAYQKFGSSKTTVWVTSDGKWLDTLVLESLVKQGKVIRHGGKARSAYATATYELA